MADDFTTRTARETYQLDRTDERLKALPNLDRTINELQGIIPNDISECWEAAFDRFLVIDRVESLPYRQLALLVSHIAKDDSRRSILQMLFESSLKQISTRFKDYRQLVLSDAFLVYMKRAYFSDHVAGVSVILICVASFLTTYNHCRHYIMRFINKNPAFYRLALKMFIFSPVNPNYVEPNFQVETCFHILIQQPGGLEFCYELLKLHKNSMKHDLREPHGSVLNQPIYVDGVASMTFEYLVVSEVGRKILGLLVEIDSGQRYFDWIFKIDVTIEIQRALIRLDPSDASSLVLMKFFIKLDPEHSFARLFQRKINNMLSSQEQQRLQTGLFAGAGRSDVAAEADPAFTPIGA